MPQARAVERPLCPAVLLGERVAVEVKPEPRLHLQRVFRAQRGIEDLRAELLHREVIVEEFAARGFPKITGLVAVRQRHVRTQPFEEPFHERHKQIGFGLRARALTVVRVLIASPALVRKKPHGKHLAVRILLRDGFHQLPPAHPGVAGRLLRVMFAVFRMPVELSGPAVVFGVDHDALRAADLGDLREHRDLLAREAPEFLVLERRPLLEEQRARDEVVRQLRGAKAFDVVRVLPEIVKGLERLRLIDKRIVS